MVILFRPGTPRAFFSRGLSGRTAASAHWQTRHRCHRKARRGQKV